MCTHWHRITVLHHADRGGTGTLGMTVSLYSMADRIRELFFRISTLNGISVLCINFLPYRCVASRRRRQTPTYQLLAVLLVAESVRRASFRQPERSTALPQVWQRQRQRRPRRAGSSKPAPSSYPENLVPENQTPSREPPYPLPEAFSFRGTGIGGWGPPRKSCRLRFEVLPSSSLG